MGNKGCPPNHSAGGIMEVVLPWIILSALIAAAIAFLGRKPSIIENNDATVDKHTERMKDIEAAQNRHLDSLKGDIKDADDKADEVISGGTDGVGDKLSNIIDRLRKSREERD